MGKVAHELMKSKRFEILFLVAISVMIDSQAAKGGWQTASGRSGTYYTGVYQNLFSNLLGKSDSEIKSKLDSAFNQLFFGDNEKQRVYYPVGDSMGYIEDVGNKDVRTEGMSYGMMIAVQMDRKDVFDRLWNWANTYMRIKDGPQKGYFAWQCKTDGSVISFSTASDGEEWFTMSLFFASARWGNGKGIYDYMEQAQDLLNTMLYKESEQNHEGVTNLFNAKEHLVVFVPDQAGSKFTDPSYQVPHYYELWARWAQKDNQFWCDAAKASRQLLKNAADSITGLSPDYSQFNGKIVSWWPGGHEDFRFDAWRVAMNVGVDYEWFHQDEWEVSECNRLLNFFKSQGIDDYVNQYTLDGKKLGGDHSKGLVAMNAVAALASTNANRKDFVEALWNAKVPTGLYRYYDGMLYMMGLLQASGNFRIYDPTGKAVPACGK
jgi:oligosaccharide reducing-end xylanase